MVKSMKVVFWVLNEGLNCLFLLLLKVELWCFWELWLIFSNVSRFFMVLFLEWLCDLGLFFCCRNRLVLEKELYLLFLFLLNRFKVFLFFFLNNWWRWIDWWDYRGLCLIYCRFLLFLCLCYYFWLFYFVVDILYILLMNIWKWI